MPGWAVILLMFALVVIALGAVRLLGRSGEKAETASARVVSKRSDTQKRSRVYQTPATVYFALFRLDDGRELGADGTLTWRGEEFLRFKPEGE